MDSPVYTLEVVAESAESRRKVGSSKPGRVKPMIYIIDTSRYLVWPLALMGYVKDWLAQCQDNVTAGDIGCW